MTLVKITGTVKIRKRGLVIYERKNLVVNAGLDLITLRLSGAGTAPSHMGIGDSGTAPVAGDTTLANQLHRVALTSAVVNNAITYSATFTGQNGIEEFPQEFGIFNAAVAGTMLCRFTCPSFTWEPAEALAVDWTINIGERG